MSPRGKRAFIPGFIDWFNKYLNADDVAGTEMLWGFRVNRQKFLPLWSFCPGRGDKMSGIPSRSHRSTVEKIRQKKVQREPRMSAFLSRVAGALLR